MNGSQWAAVNRDISPLTPINMKPSLVKEDKHTNIYLYFKF